jgi:DNA-binding PadR family transcriptional regulator
VSIPGCYSCQEYRQEVTFVPNTTHMSLLCLLSARDWNAYELVGQMGRSVGAVWPRAESNLYADLKRLDREGLATASADHATGRRKRTTYSITPAGRSLLEEWLATAGAPPSFECEALLKLAFAPATTKEATLAQVAVMAEHARARIELGARLGDEHAGNDGPLPERLHVNAVMWRFLWEQNLAVARWAEWAEQEIESWPSTADSPALRQRGRRAIAAALAAWRSGR